MVNIPTEQDAIRILAAALNKRVQAIRRFPTGLAHYVYDVETDAGENLVIRLARSDLGAFFEGALHWYAPLKRLDVPLPVLYFASADSAQFGFPVMIMERLPGQDLGEVYGHLSTGHKQRLADAIIAIQRSVATLPPGQGYGYARSAADRALHPCWLNVLEASLERSTRRFETSGVVGQQAAERVRQAVYAHRAYFDAVPPTCFLDDTTTKNVIIADDGRLSGIVDVDAVAFGDPLLTLSLTQMALLSQGYDTVYTDYWAAQLQLTPAQQHAVRLYTALFCLDFMSELGQSFNKAAPIAVDQTQVEKFLGILAALIP